MYKQFKVGQVDCGGLSKVSPDMLLWEKIQKEYNESQSKSGQEREEMDHDLKTIRIFISSTFKDFYNEREVLVKSIFPRLRRWCEEEGLFLVECDLRWGVPTDATSVEAVSICLDEIEKGRKETYENNFFIGLIGDRFGWVPSEPAVIEELRNKYDWITDSSVTLMEIVHGVIRSRTQNCIFMMRSSESLENIPLHHLHFFQEEQDSLKSNVNQLKHFLHSNFSNGNCSFQYTIKYDSNVVDKISGKERLVFTGFEDFSQIIEETLKVKISDFKKKFNISSTIEDKNDDMLHKSYLRSLDKAFRRESYLNIIKERLDDTRTQDLPSNPIYLISGEAGTGKSTLIGNLIQYLEEKKVGNIFYHFCGASNTSHSLSNIGERFVRYVNTVFGISLSEPEGQREDLVLHDLLQRDEIPQMIVIIDALDEISGNDFDKCFPKFTSSNILLVASVLKEDDVQSKYLTLKNSERSIIDISIEPMDKGQLSSIVSSYLNNFGKRLDQSQMNALMNFNCSTNPLWLLSACEELRIHGDYSTLKDVILSLPCNISDLNRIIIQRLMTQDTTNLVQCFLKIMIVSKAGVWESVVHDLLASMMEYKDPVSHSTWLDIVRQLKGFLQIESVPLPLIKFRHRVTKQSIETELQLDDEIQKDLHLRMSNFFEGTSENENKLFLGDFVYHLIKSDSRDRMLTFMRSKRSWSLFNQSFIRSKIMMSMRCINPTNTLPQQKPSDLTMCVSCANQSGRLSLYGMNRNCCFFCGNFTQNNDTLSRCVHHSSQIMLTNKCALCGNFNGNQGVPVKVCDMCKSVGFPRKCGVLVQENDILFRQQLGFSKAAYNIDNLI